MISYHGDKGIKDQLLKNLDAHAKADGFRQGGYWSEEDGKGCAVGCSIVDFGGEVSNHKEYERLLGIPQALARIEDGIFEGLSVEDSKWWPKAFAEAVPVGKDLSMVSSKFLIWLLNGVKKYASSDGVDAIEKVVSLYEQRIGGLEPSRSEWLAAYAYAAAADADAAYAAYAAYAAAADAAYAAAAYAADADAYAAGRQGARKEQALELIEILKAE